MRLYTPKDSIATIAERWRRQYYHAASDTWYNGGVNKLSREDIYIKLQTVTTIEEIDELIGNDTWTTRMCAECREPVRTWIVLGERYNSEYAQCLPCTEQAYWVFLEEQRLQQRR